jgi:hypothetical protein
MGIFRLTRKPAPLAHHTTPPTPALRSCILEFERLSPSDQTLGSIKSISVEEFEFCSPTFTPTSPSDDFSPIFLNYEALVGLLKSEMRFHEDREMIYYVVANRMDGFREVKSDISLRGAVRMLRSSGQCVLRLYVKQKAEFATKPRKIKEAVESSARVITQVGADGKKRKRAMLGRQPNVEEEVEDKK